MAVSPEFKSLSWALVHRGRVFELGIEEVVLPGGTRTRLDLIRHPGAAAVLPLGSKGEVLLLRQFRRAAEAYLWEIPAGTREPGEDPATCARRELAEEAGFRASTWIDLGDVLPAPGYTTETIRLFAARDLEPVATRRDDDEIISEVRGFRADELWDAVRAGTLRDGKTMAALLRALALGLLDHGSIAGQTPGGS